MTEHKHAAVLRAIADGKAVQYKPVSQFAWQDADCLEFSKDPITYPNYEWRIKPEPKPDVVRYWAVSNLGGFVSPQKAKELFPAVKDIVCVTFDGETGKLKSAEVLP